MWVSSRALEIFLLTFLIDLILTVQILCFCFGCLSRSYEICIQTTFSRWRRCKRTQIVNFKPCKTRAEWTCASCSASGCCAEFVDVAEKIMNAVSLSSTQQVALECVCFRFLLAKASDSACGQNLMVFYFDTKKFASKFIPKFRRAITVSNIL